MSASHRQLGGRTQPNGWGSINRLGDESDVITVEVNNVLTEKRINNVFGVIKGFVDAGTAKMNNERDPVIRKYGNDASDECPVTVCRSIRGHWGPEGCVGPGLCSIKRGHQRPRRAGAFHL